MTTILRPGMIVRRTAPFTHPRDYQIVSIADGVAILAPNSTERVQVATKRIYTDGKPRRSGWSVRP